MAMAQIEWVAETPSRKFGRIDAPWNDQIAAFTDANMSLVLPENVVEARLAGYDSSSRTRLIPVKVKGKKTILYKGTELVTPAGAGEIVRAHLRKIYPIRSTDFYDALEAIAQSQESLKPEDRIAVIVAKDGDHLWGEEMPQRRFALGPQAIRYFREKVEPFKRTEIPFFDLKANSTRYANINYVWFSGPQYGSGLYCGDWLLGGDYPAFGMLEKTAGGGSRP